MALDGPPRDDSTHWPSPHEDVSPVGFTPTAPPHPDPDARDPVTGLPTRDALFEQARGALATALPFCLMVVTPRISGQDGMPISASQQAAIQRHIGSMLQAHLGANEEMAYGPQLEEFTIMTFRSSCGYARELAQRMIHTLTRQSWPVNVVLAIGISGYPGHAERFDCLLRMAQDAVAQASRLPSSRIVVADELVSFDGRKDSR